MCHVEYCIRTFATRVRAELDRIEVCVHVYAFALCLRHLYMRDVAEEPCQLVVVVLHKHMSGSFLMYNGVVSGRTFLALSSSEAFT